MIARTQDPRRAIMVNAAAYQRQMNRKPEPAVSFGQSLLMALALVAFVGGGLLLLGGV